MQCGQKLYRATMTQFIILTILQHTAILLRHSAPLSKKYGPGIPHTTVTLTLDRALRSPWGLFWSPVPKTSYVHTNCKLQMSHISNAFPTPGFCRRPKSKYWIQNCTQHALSWSLGFEFWMCDNAGHELNPSCLCQRPSISANRPHLEDKTWTACWPYIPPWTIFAHSDTPSKSTASRASNRSVKMSEITLCSLLEFATKRSWTYLCALYTNSYVTERGVNWPPRSPDLSAANFFPLGVPHGHDVLNTPRQHRWLKTENMVVCWSHSK